MKKFIIFCLLLSLSVTCLYAYALNTSKGEVEVNIPEGMTAEEAFYSMSKLYLEERWDHEDLIEKSKALSESVDSYIKEIDNLKNQNKSLISNYEKVVGLYTEATKVKTFSPFLGASLNTNFDSNVVGCGITFGGMLFEKLLLHTTLSFPWSIQVGINILL